jgi:drug/metabolite transporter (DMT)-like permease
MARPVESERAAVRRTIAGVAFAFGAALAYGAAQVLTRHGVSDLAPPLVGSLIALFSGTVGFAILSAGSLGHESGNLRRGAAMFAGAGIFSAVGVVLMFLALYRGQVVVVAPVLATNSLFTLLFAVLLLRGVERMTARIALGALLVVAGVVVLTVA